MVDNRHYHEKAWLELGRRRGLGITQEYYRAHIHSRGNMEIGRLLLGEDADPKTIVEMSEEKEAVYRELYRPELREIAGLGALLEELAKAGIPCAAVSNSPKGNVDLVLDGLGIRDAFKLVIDRDQVTNGKPDPELLLTAAERLGLQPAYCLVLEDSVSGFGCAEAAGTPYIVVTAGADPNELVHAKHPAAMVHDFTELTVALMQDWAIGSAARRTST